MKHHSSHHPWGDRIMHNIARAMRGGRGESFARPGFGRGGEGEGRGGGRGRRRMFEGGELRLVLLLLIESEPRHGYDLIREIETRTGGVYSPSPGIVYPTLTYLEEAGYVTAATEGSKKLYTITDEGRAYLDSHGDLIKIVLDRLTALGERVNRWRSERGDRDNRRDLPPLVEASFDNLRDIVAKRLGGDAEAESRLVEILARAATELQKS